MKKLILNILGAVFLGIGAIGIIVPILPTTPFIILASICFVNNIKMTTWLMRNKYFSAYINNYKQKLGVPLQIKIKSIIFIILAFSISIFFVDIFWVRCLLVLIALAVSVHIILLRNLPNNSVRNQLNGEVSMGEELITLQSNSMNTMLTIEKIESERLVLRRMTQDDFVEVAHMLQDVEVMYAWEHAFGEDEVADWIQKRITMYAKVGYDYMLAVDKTSGQIVGQIGLLDEAINGSHEIGIGYILKKEFWNKGYATEGAKACMEYAFDKLDASRIVLTVRPENSASINVAERLGMTLIGEEIKHYNGKNMPHCIYSMKNIQINKK